MQNSEIPAQVILLILLNKSCVLQTKTRSQCKSN